MTAMQLSSSRRRRLIVAAVVLAVSLVAFLGYTAWRRTYPAEQTYKDMVSAFYTGVIALNVGDDEHALSGLTLATQLVPAEPAAWADLGVFALRHNNLDGARTDLEKAHDLAPKNGQILTLLGLLETQQGSFGAAVGDYKQAVEDDPSDLRARYALEESLNQQGTDADPEAQKQLQAIYQAAPENLFAEFKLAGAAAKAGQGDLLRQVVAKIAAHSAGWTPALRSDLKAAQTAAAHSDTRAAVAPLLGLQNELAPLPQYQQDAAKIQGDTTNQGTPLEQFLVLPQPPATPAAPDTALKFTPQPLPVPGTGPWNWVRTVLLTPDGAPTTVAANGHQLQIGTTSLPFPGGAQAIPPTSDGVAAFDANNNFLQDFACAGAGGLRLYQQGKGGTFADVTSRSKLPPGVLGAPYTGVWAADIDTDGDLDLILGSATGPPTVLRNNGDGTWNVLHPFGPMKSGLSQFVWADLDGDGSPDAAYLDRQGKLTVLQNKRAGAFTPWRLPTDVQTNVLALSAADVARTGTQALVVQTSDGRLLSLSLKTDDSGWDRAELGQTTVSRGDVSDRLRWADVDNNGALDLIVTNTQGTQVLLGDAGGKLVPLNAPADAVDVTVDAQAVKGRLDLIGLDDKGQPTRLVNTGSKDYAWQEVRLRAASQGDKRNNTYGVGGEIGLRAGLLYENQLVAGPVTHFGLGEYKKADAIRILWPNGSPQGEFELKADQLAEAPERLKGSCPWLFADDGTGMKFVTDFIWRSPLGLRINAQDTAGVVQTRDWVKIRDDQLKARDGFYNLRITADLWETHFFDQVALMTVDHPAGTDVNVDERFAIPPPPLTVRPMTPPRPVVRATDDRGQDVTSLVSARDGTYLDTFGRGDYQGVTRDHWVTLDLGPDTARGGPVWLVGIGWIHPTDSSINVALGQGYHAPPRDLSLEVPDGKGGWAVAKPHLGFPEGKNKTVLIDLTGLLRPGLPRQVRLRTNLEIYWDFLGTAQALPKTPMRTQTLALERATLRYRGFSATHQANASSPEVPDYAQVGGTSPRWLDLEGYYTRYGDVRELLARTDDRYVIMNAGDEMALRFTAPPPPPAGWTRDYVLIGDGWVKDGDYNTAFSRTVLPLPAHSRPAYNVPPGRLQDDPVYKAHRGDWMTYQTRWVSPQRFRAAMRP